MGGRDGKNKVGTGTITDGPTPMFPKDKTWTLKNQSKDHTNEERRKRNKWEVKRKKG